MIRFVFVSCGIEIRSSLKKITIENNILSYFTLNVYIKFAYLLSRGTREERTICGR